MDTSEPALSCTTSPGTKIKLRRRDEPGKDNIIRRNLDNLKRNSVKKKIAQALYYGISPNDTTDDSICNFKKPVHARLGKRRFFRFPNTTTISLPPKNPRYFKRFQRPSRNFTYTAQSRLMRLRQDINGLHTQSRKFKLQRNNVNPTNLVVRVPNKPRVDMRHSIRAELDPTLQKEIIIIQKNTNQHQEVGDDPMLVTSTNITVNERFTLQG